MQSFYQMINSRAETGFDVTTLNKDNYEEVWFPRWFKAAEDIRDEFLDEGLIRTADAIQKIIDSSRKMTEKK